MLAKKSCQWIILIKKGYRFPWNRILLHLSDAFFPAKGTPNFVGGNDSNSKCLALDFLVDQFIMNVFFDVESALSPQEHNSLLCIGNAELLQSAKIKRKYRIKERFSRVLNSFYFSEFVFGLLKRRCFTRTANVLLTSAITFYSYNPNSWKERAVLNFNYFFFH